MKRRKICVVTTSRADFGHLLSLMRAIRADRDLRLQVIASGTHLLGSRGQTCEEIEREGLRVDRAVPMLLGGDSAQTNAQSIGVGLLGIAPALAELGPDVLVLLGDRFELLAPASAALLLRIPIAHIHGGERSEGAIDEAVRHAVTKMACLHFAATEVYRRRIVQMGEAPDRVFHFGAPGLDRIHGDPLPGRVELEKDLGLSFDENVALVTYHPATLDGTRTDSQVDQLLAAVLQSGVKAVFTMANADAEGARINARLAAFCSEHASGFRWIPHLGHRRYLGCLRHAALMLGNSSSGLTEAPSFRLPVVNIGDRQRGRVRAANVIDVPCELQPMLGAIRRARSREFRASLRGMRNPYDRYHDGRVGERIKDVLKEVELSDDLLRKTFHDLE